MPGFGGRFVKTPSFLRDEAAACCTFDFFNEFRRSQRPAHVRALADGSGLVGNEIQGKIIIEYYTLEDLQRVWDLIMGK